MLYGIKIMTTRVRRGGVSLNTSYPRENPDTKHPLWRVRLVDGWMGVREQAHADPILIRLKVKVCRKSGRTRLVKRKCVNME